MLFTRLDAKMDNTYVLGSDSEISVRKLNPNFSFKHLQTRESCIKDPHPQSSGDQGSRISKHVVSLDGKYLRRCLELIRISASKAASSKISVNLTSGMMGILANPAEMKGEETFDTTQFVFECPLADEFENVVTGPARQETVGSVTGSRQFDTLDGDVNFRKTISEDDKTFTCYSFMNSPGGLGFSSAQKLMREEASPENHKFGPESLYNRLASVSSSNSTCSDQSLTASASVSQGMLQCTWRGGRPHFVFSVDGQKEVYVANLSKQHSSDGKALNHVYLLHSTKNTRKAHEIDDVESHLVGKMKVSTSFTLCPNNSRVMETEFILYGNNAETPSHNLGKIKGLSKKVVDVFKTSNSSKQRTLSKFSGSSAVQEYCSWNPHQDTSNNIDELGEVDLLEKHLPPNFELAAIVVRDHLPDKRQGEVGGWGLKFLKNDGMKHTGGSIDDSVCCGCSTHMDILVPAGLHGGPKTRNDGPSSLIKRWKSGGCCDCGGWDVGCPLTVLSAQPSKEAALHKADVEGERKAFDLTVKTSEHSSATLRMVTVHGELYLVQFQPVLSALQSFSIAVAFMHTRLKVYRI